MTPHEKALRQQRQLYRIYQAQCAQITNSVTNTIYSIPTGAYTNNTAVWINSPTSTIPLWQTTSWPDYKDEPFDDGVIDLHVGFMRKLRLPDGTIIDVAADGSFTINDSNAKVTYRANRTRDFNPFVNASDKLESFIKFCGEAGVTQSEMLDIPVKHFIGWLILEAARADGDNPAYAPLIEGMKHELRHKADTRTRKIRKGDRSKHRRARRGRSKG